LVEERHPGAVIFANRTVNADRGYTEKMQVEHSGSVAARGYQMEDIMPYLDIDTRRKILDAIAQKKLDDTGPAPKGDIKLIEA
jgi:hypothetical protein